MASTALERWNFFELIKNIFKNLNGTKNLFIALFFEVTSLFGRIKMKKLPKDGYKWCEIKNIDELIGKCRSNTDFGYFVEIDLEYPREIHDDHSDFPLAPERLGIKDDWLSTNKKNLVSNRSAVPKLVETLFDKRISICHIENFLFYIDQGLKIGRPHSVLQFNQSDWLRPHIEKNTVMRKQASKKFE